MNWALAVQAPVDVDAWSVGDESVEAMAVELGPDCEGSVDGAWALLSEVTPIELVLGCEGVG